MVAAIVTGLIAAIFGGSNVQVSGPTGAMVVVLAPIVVTHGIGAIIFMQQVPAAVGFTGQGHSNAAVAAVQAVTGTSWPAALAPVVVVVAVLAIVLVLGKVTPKVPASFVAIVVVPLMAMALSVPLDTTGELPRSLPAPSLLAMDLAMLQALAGPAVAGPAVAAIESLPLRPGGGVNGRHRALNPDRELVGQGLASVGAGFFAGMPATGAIARTAVNVRSGGHTRLSVIIRALVLLAVIYVAVSVVSVIPLAALFGVLMSPRPAWSPRRSSAGYCAPRSLMRRHSSSPQ